MFTDCGLFSGLQMYTSLQRGRGFPAYLLKMLPWRRQPLPRGRDCELRDAQFSAVMIFLEMVTLLLMYRQTLICMYMWCLLMDMPIAVVATPLLTDMYVYVVQHVMDALTHSFVVYDLEIQIMIFSFASCISSPGM